MVWSVKYRRKILNSEIEKYLKELVQQIAEDKGFTVHLFECGEGDHVHCFVTAPPKLSITAIVKSLKGITGRKLFERFPEIRNQLWKGELLSLIHIEMCIRDSCKRCRREKTADTGGSCSERFTGNRGNA